MNKETSSLLKRVTELLEEVRCKLLEEVEPEPVVKSSGCKKSLTELFLPQQTPFADLNPRDVTNFLMEVKSEYESRVMGYLRLQMNEDHDCYIESVDAFRDYSWTNKFGTTQHQIVSVALSPKELLEELDLSLA